MAFDERTSRLMADWFSWDLIAKKTSPGKQLNGSEGDHEWSIIWNYDESRRWAKMQNVFQR